MIARSRSRTSGGVAVDIDDKAALSLAVSAPDLDSAQTAAYALEQRLARDANASMASGHVFVVRGGALALLRVQAREPLAVLSAAAHEIERLRREGSDAKPAPPTGEDLNALARRLALRWATHSDRALERAARARRRRARRGRTRRPRGARTIRMRRCARAGKNARSQHSRRSRARRAAHGRQRRRGSASVVLDNGAHIELRRRASEQVAVALRFARGAASEPPLMHGRTALLAHCAASTACAGLSAQALADRLQALGARLEPQVDAESWGLLLTRPRRAGSRRSRSRSIARCIPRSSAPDLATARLRLRERLGASGGPGETSPDIVSQARPPASWPAAITITGVIRMIAAEEFEKLRHSISAGGTR